jgi:hypothetical protein
VHDGSTFIALRRGRLVWDARFVRRSSGLKKLADPYETETESEDNRQRTPNRSAQIGVENDHDTDDDGRQSTEQKPQAEQGHSLRRNSAQNSSMIGSVPWSTILKGRFCGPGSSVSRLIPRPWNTVAAISAVLTGRSLGA